MKIEQNVVIEKGDIEALKKHVGNSPCVKCSNRGGCCGCPEGDAYNKSLQDVKDRNLLDVKTTLISISKGMVVLRECFREVSDLCKEIPKEFKGMLTLNDIYQITACGDYPDDLLDILNKVYNPPTESSNDEEASTDKDAIIAEMKQYAINNDMSMPVLTSAIWETMPSLARYQYESAEEAVIDFWEVYKEIKNITV